jgi:putative transposase
VVTDTQGNVLQVAVTTANTGDRAGAEQVFEQMEGHWQRLFLLRADGGYCGDEWVERMIDTYGVYVQVVPRLGDGFVVQPRRWVIERTFAWFGFFRRLSKRYERLTSSDEAWIYIARIPHLTAQIAG